MTGKNYTMKNVKVESPISLLENGCVVIATLMLGLMAGFFWTYSINVSPALMSLDGDMYGRVQSLLNQNVRHPMFFVFFFDSAGATAVAALANWRHWRTWSFWLIVISLLVYAGGVVGFTKLVNLPLNYYTESWLPGSVPGDWEQVRSRWNSANLFRVGASASAFGLCVIALMIRATVRN